MSCEPVAVFSWLAFGMLSLARTKGLYQYACQSLYSSDVSVDCLHIGSISDENKVDEIQKTATAWNIYVALAVLTPSIPANILLGKQESGGWDR